MKKKIVVILIGAALICTGCAKKEMPSIDMNSGENTKTQTYQENNTEYDTMETTEQKSSLQETSSSTQHIESFDSAQDNKTQQETSNSVQSNETLQEVSDNVQDNGTTQDLYTAFIKNAASVTVEDNSSQNDYKTYNLEQGKTYTFAELGACVNASYFDPEYSVKTSYDNAQYAYLESSNNHTRILLVKFSGLEIYTLDDDSFAVYVIAENQGKLYLTGSYECWARSDTKACKNGLLVSGGSAGAGDHIAAVSAVLADGKIVDIDTTEILSGWWANCIQEGIYNEIFADTGNGDINFSVMIHTIGDKTLYSYDLSECTDDQVSVCETFLNRCRDEAGINWITEEQVQKAIQERCNVLNIDYEMVGQQEEVEWIEIG